MTEILDPHRMQDLTNSLGEGLKDVIDSYLEDTPVRIEGLRSALDRGCWDDLQRIAHSLKSSSGIFGAKEMVAACRALEIAAGEGESARLDLIQEIVDAYEKVRVVLNSYLGSE